MRERDRYPRQTLGERLGEAWAWFRGYRNAQIVVGAIVLGVLAMLVLSPSTVRFDELAVGDCVFVRTRSAVDLDVATPIGDPGTISAILLAEGAERTGCGQNHGHEVIATSTMHGTDDGFPGAAALRDLAEPACRAAFEPYVGRPAEGSAYLAFVVVPDEERWTAGTRSAACLLQRADGRYMDHPARDSGE